MLIDIKTCVILTCCRYAVDLVVCVALGCDMFDCVFPTRTAVSSLYLTELTNCILNSDCCNSPHQELIPDTCVFSFTSEVWLCLGALGITPSKT